MRPEERLEMAEAGRKVKQGRAWEIARRKQRLEVERQEVAERLQMEEPRRDPGGSRGWKKE